jgi:hypothetical protein
MNRISLSIKSFVLFVVLSFLFPMCPNAEETADQILQKIYNNQVSEGFQVAVELVTPGKSNLEITVLGKINLDTTQLLIFFNEPASSKGMKLLFISKRKVDPLLFIYMPQSKQYFQLNGENLNMQIGDSEATLGDLIPMVEWDGTHTLLGLETFKDESCHIIETRREWEGGKRILKIGAQTFLSYSMEQFDENNKLMKKLETLETREIGGKLCATSLKVTNYLGKGKGTLINFLSGDMSIVLPDELFEPSNLKNSYNELMHLGEDVL